MWCRKVPFRSPGPRGSPWGVGPEAYAGRARLPKNTGFRAGNALVIFAVDETPPDLSSDVHRRLQTQLGTRRLKKGSTHLDLSPRPYPGYPHTSQPRPSSLPVRPLSCQLKSRHCQELATVSAGGNKQADRTERALAGR
ncbi:hypothetical protein DPEC_G00314250 [Dallia pectoralis]|uniref:Uncharacterized protein n=1 Tax=Dallia pectoralis TaxID=75939 RepID=A0ACC2FBY7_DALPE|nr:hypothetical protein DPEC_G00314250 [Dallia pectoralis]